MPDFFGESEDFMRVMMPNGTLVTVEKAIPVNECVKWRADIY